MSTSMSTRMSTSTSTTNERTTLILGGTGKTGRRVAARLEARGQRVKVSSRSGAPPFDWKAPETWEPVLRGAHAMYVAYHPDLAVPGAADDVERLAKTAVALGVRRIVLLSGRGEEGVLPGERAVRESGAEWTILRAAWFCQNFSEGWLLPAVQGGELAFPAGEVAEPFVDCDDLAEIAARALAEPGHAGQIYELTGPRLLTFGQAVSAIAQASGRAVSYVPVTGDAYASALGEHLPPEQVRFMIELFAEVLDGHNAYVTDDVARVLGRAPRDFAEFARDAAQSGCWDVSGAGRSGR
jgi:uncharacterized protein YbjT (DUF2867 family)